MLYIFKAILSVMVKKNQKGLVLFFIIILSVSIFLIKLFSGYNFERKKERITELYFSDHLNLPKEIDLQTNYSFEFTTHNLEYEEVLYNYEVLISDSGGIRPIAKGEFNLLPNQSINVPINLAASTPFGKMKVSVKLIGKNQEINFWITENL